MYFFFIFYQTSVIFFTKMGMSVTEVRLFHLKSWHVGTALM